MGNLIPDSRPKHPSEPLTVEDISYNPFPFSISEYELQLQVDALNALEARLPMESFSKARQEEIKTYYKFSGISQNSKSHNIANLTKHTNDIIL